MQFRIQDVCLYKGTFVEQVVEADNVAHAVAVFYGDDDEELIKWVNNTIIQNKSNSADGEFVVKGEEQVLLIKQV